MNRFRFKVIALLLGLFLGGMQSGFYLLEVADRGTSYAKLALSLTFSILMAWQLWQSVFRTEPR
jgi:hypothetical protein